MSVFEVINIVYKKVKTNGILVKYMALVSI